MMWGACGGRLRSAVAALSVAVALLLLGACGDVETSPAVGQSGLVTTPRTVPTVDLVAKNLTATAYRPTADLVIPSPTMIGTSSTVWISHGGPIVDHVTFVDKLRGERCSVDPAGTVRQSFLRAEGIVLRVSGCGLTRPAELQSFWYHTDNLGIDGLRAAEEDARGIGPVGQPAWNASGWSAAPHFFRRERAFVLYLGDDPAQFAGR